MKNLGDRYSAPLAAIVVLYAVFGGCGNTLPKNALTLTEESLANRQLQTRRFATQDEKQVLAACAGLAQDLGFVIDSSDTKLGVIVGSKERDATEAGQVIGSILVAALTGVATPVDDKQRIRASIVTNKDARGIAVRVTFQRVVWNNQGQVSRLERIGDPQMYQQFFERLSKAVFLEAQQI
jgi:hypothetical protein